MQHPKTNFFEHGLYYAKFDFSFAISCQMKIFQGFLTVRDEILCRAHEMISERNVFMKSDRLYELAILYRKEKLWKSLTETSLFAVRLSDGNIGYCSVMGREGTHIALGLYLGEEGLASFFHIAEADGYDSDMDEFFAGFMQKCLQCSFENKDHLSPEEWQRATDYGKRHQVSFRGKMSYPHFITCVPFHFPETITDATEELLLAEALEAALDVCDKVHKKRPSALGFTSTLDRNKKIPVLTKEGSAFSWSMEPLPAVEPIRYPRPKLSNEILAGKLKKAKKKGHLLCDLCLIPTPTMDEDAPEDPSLHLPVTMLSFNTETEMLLPVAMVLDYDKNDDKFLDEFANILSSSLKKIPSDIHVKNDRTYDALDHFCQQVGIRLHREDDLPELDVVEENYLAFGMDSDSEEDQLEEMEHMTSEMIQRLGHMSEKELKQLPSEMRFYLTMLMESGIMPPELERKLKKVWK